MQLIPFVLSVFFILSMLALTLQKEVRQMVHFQARVQEHLSIDQEFLNASVDSFFDSLPQKKKKGGKGASGVIKTFQNHRQKGVLLNARLYIKPLFLKNEPVLKEVAFKFLTSLYPSSFGFDPESLLEEILEKGSLLIKEQPDIATFSVYDLPNPSSQLLKALEGTCGYCFGKKNAYPPLGDYLELYHKSQRSPISSTYASLPLLTAIFGCDGVQKVLEEESRRFLESDGNSPYCNTKDLKELFSTNPKQDPRVFQLLSDGLLKRNASDGVELIVLDPKLHLEARGTLRTYPLKKFAAIKEVPSQIRSTPGV
jgi:hypothetical protein